MTERIDHVAEAMKCVEYANSPQPGSPEVAANFMAQAAVHATLALVEQQRVANLIAAEWGKVCEDAELDTDATAAEVVDALRLQGFQNIGEDVPAPAEPEQGYTVELGGQVFTQAQWEAVQRYCGGTSAEPEYGHECREPKSCDCEPSEDERYNPVYDIITDVLDEYTDMGVRHEVAVEIIDRVRIAGAWPTGPSEEPQALDPEKVSEAQVEAAARVYDPEAWAARDKYAADGTGTQVELDLMVEYSLGKARAALVAAQGAAPQAEIHEPNHDRVYCVRCGGNWPCQPAPVLPSSGVGEDDCWHEANCRCVRAGTVDEEKLAEVIGSLDCGYMVDGPSVSEVARAVAEWLNEGENG